MNYLQNPKLVKKVLKYAKKNGLLKKPSIIKRELGLQASRQLIAYWVKKYKRKGGDNYDI